MVHTHTWHPNKKAVTARLNLVYLTARCNNMCGGYPITYEYYKSTTTNEY